MVVVVVVMVVTLVVTPQHEQSTPKFKLRAKIRGMTRSVVVVAYDLLRVIIYFDNHCYLFLWC